MTNVSGLGCLAGPIAVGAVFLNGYSNPKIRDSKTIKNFNSIFRIGSDIEANCASVVKFASVTMVDYYGTWKAWEILVNEVIFAMRAKYGMNIPVILDGTRIPKGQYNVQAIPKADTKYPAVSAASIVTKMRRHYYMKVLDKFYPEFNFGQTDGYGTQAHLEALAKHGPNKHHRKKATNTAIQNYLKKQRRNR